MSSLALSVFDFQSQSVRILSIDGEPWFVARDVLQAINSKTKVTDLAKVIIDELGGEFVGSEYISDSLGRRQETLILSEAAMTLFVSRSRTDLGKQMNKWIHSEVLPSIRKTGNYVQPTLIEEPKPLILPPVDVRVYNLANALSLLGIDATNPRWSSGIKDLVIDILGVAQPLLPAKEDKWRGVVEIALDLGFNQAHKLEIRSSLGKYISKQAKKLNLERKQEERLCNGTSRLIWLYKETDELLELITNYFTEV
jgi:prophage antirepressor-like protein